MIEACFDKLHEACVKARRFAALPHYKGELPWLRERIEELGRVIEIVCFKCIRQLEKGGSA